MLADVDSLFMDCKGLVVHYKITEGNSPSSQVPSSNVYDSINNYGISSSISSPSFPTVWNPLVRTPTSGSLFSSSVHTPLLSSHSSFKSSSQSGIPSDLNGWPAIMQHTQRGMSEGLGLPSMPSSNGKGVCSNARTTGVVFLHGFGGGVFSWRHVMSTVAREVGCRVVAFDRPGWGLTSRPRRSEWEQKRLPNPYDLHTQVSTLLPSTVATDELNVGIVSVRSTLYKPSLELLRPFSMKFLASAKHFECVWVCLQARSLIFPVLLNEEFFGLWQYEVPPYPWILPDMSDSVPGAKISSC